MPLPAPINIRKIRAMLTDLQPTNAEILIEDHDQRRILKLKGCRFAAFPPPFLEQAPLHQLSLIDCIVKEWIPAPQMLATLRHLELSNCQIAKFPWPDQTMPHLRTLILSHNDLHTLYLDIHRFPGLDHLDLGYNPHLCFHPEFPKMDRLRQLTLAGTDAKNAEILTKTPQVVMANLASMRLKEVPPSLLNLPKCRIIVLNGNEIAEIPFDRFKTSWLESFTAHNNCIERVSGMMNQPQYLYEFGCQNNLITSFPEFLRHCANLQFLDLSTNKLPMIPRWIASLKSLKYLDIASNPFVQPPTFLYSLDLDTLTINMQPNNPLQLEAFKLAQSVKAMKVCTFDPSESPLKKKNYFISSYSALSNQPQFPPEPKQRDNSTLSHSEYDNRDHNPQTISVFSNNENRDQTALIKYSTTGNSGYFFQPNYINIEKEPPPLPSIALDFGGFPSRLCDKVRFNAPLTKGDVCHPFVQAHPNFLIEFCQYHDNLASRRLMRYLSISDSRKAK